MKHKFFIITILFMAIMVGNHVAQAADVTGSIDFNSAYEWRGLIFNDGLVAQPSVDISSGGFGFNVWGNIDLDDYDKTLEEGKFSEIDLTLSYSFNIDSLSISAGVIEYLFPNTTSHSTREAFLSLGVGIIDGLSLAFDGYYDFEEVDDYYLNLGISYELEPVKDLTVASTISVGAAGEDASSGEDGGFHDYKIALSIGYAVTKEMSVAVNAAYVSNVDDDVLADPDVNFYGGLGISYQF
ncbi:hypothetical protein MHK_007658 [Candidatus Magnetomorum sp. HK-1]|nr:hypothetical protein MHK_007658 [Candidatus Magnetomorum sp. HK-1]